MDHDERMAWAQFRFSVIAPLVCRKIESEEQRRALTNEILAQVYVSPDGHQRKIVRRTLNQWVLQHKKFGFEGLLDAQRSTRGTCRAISPEVLERAVALRQQEPSRSIRMLLGLLKAEGYNVSRVSYTTLTCT